MSKVIRFKMITARHWVIGYYSNNLSLVLKPIIHLSKTHYYVFRWGHSLHSNVASANDFIDQILSLYNVFRSLIRFCLFCLHNSPIIITVDCKQKELRQTIEQNSSSK